jgi:hypothetical protein
MTDLPYGEIKRCSKSSHFQPQNGKRCTKSPYAIQKRESWQVEIQRSEVKPHVLTRINERGVQKPNAADGKGPVQHKENRRGVVKPHRMRESKRGVQNPSIRNKREANSRWRLKAV